MRRDVLVGPESEGRILRVYLEKVLESVPPKMIRKSIQRGQITVDGDRVNSNHRLKSGDRIQIHIQTSFASIPGFSLRILHIDDHVAAVFKPEGYVVGGSRGDSFVDHVRASLPQSELAEGLYTPAPLHRLDKPTSGILLFARTRTAVSALSHQFEAHTIQKEYTAVVHGCLNEGITVNSDIDGKHAETRVEYVDGSHEFSIVKVHPRTGRKHQIRIHLARAGHPIIGDTLYNDISKPFGQLLLCASSVTFEHPHTGAKTTVSVDLPEYFAAWLDQSSTSSPNSGM